MKTAFASASVRFHFGARLGRSLAFLTAAALGLKAPLHAHGDLDLQIQAVSAEIAAGPTAPLFLKRGVLHHEHEDYARALGDFAAALRLDPQLDAAWLARGRALFRAGNMAEAAVALDHYLGRHPAHADAWLWCARIQAAAQHRTASVRAFDRHLALAAQPRPESFLERAAVVAAADGTLAALASLDEGISRLGNLVTLQHAAIALEIELGRHPAALARVDRILADLPRKETWLARRGEILEMAGRPHEARAAFAEALAAIDRLPTHHREAPAMRDLQASLRRKLAS